jgi:hypothetical protein
MRSQSTSIGPLILIIFVATSHGMVYGDFWGFGRDYAVLRVDLQHDRLDRGIFPSERTQKFTVVMEIPFLRDDSVDHIEFWIWMPQTSGVPKWSTNLLSVTPTYPAGSHTIPTYDHDGWYVCEVDSPPSSYFSFGDIISLVFKVEVPGNLSPLPLGEYYDFMKFYGIISGDFPGEDQLSAASYVIQPFSARFNVEPFIYPVDTPVSFYEPDTSGMKFTFDVSPKLVQIPFGVEQPWHIEAEFEVLVDDKIEWVWFMPHLVSTMEEVPVPAGFFDPDGWWPENLDAIIIDKDGVHTGEDFGHYDFTMVGDYFVYFNFDGYKSDEDIDGQWTDPDFFITFYTCSAQAPEGSFFSKGDIIQFSFDITSPTLAFGSTPHELIKASYVTSCEWGEDRNDWNPYDVEKRVSVYRWVNDTRRKKSARSRP